MDPKQMNEYVGTKRLRATPMTLGEYNALREWGMPGDENPQAKGYLVEYMDGGKPNVEGFDGYVSWSPADVFEKSYNCIDEGITFGQALMLLGEGKKVARKGWNGKGMYLWILPGTNVPAEWCKEPHLKGLAEANGGHVECLPSVRMHTADHKVLTGWLASQTDMLATDWVVVG